jgi:hypothetical protein
MKKAHPIVLMGILYWNSPCFGTSLANYYVMGGTNAQLSVGQPKAFQAGQAGGLLTRDLRVVIAA